MPGPPSSQEVIRWGPTAMAALAMPIAALTVCCLREEELTDEQKAERASELTNRRQRVIEIVRLSEEAVGKEVVTIEGQGLEDEDDGQINFQVFLRRCKELVDIDRDAKELPGALDWCGKRLLYELQFATQKTAAQKDLAYADGSKLEKLLDGPEDLYDIARRHRKPILAKLTKDISTARTAAQWVRRWQRVQDLGKAGKMLVLAKEAWPWMIASSLTSMLSASISATSFHYRAEFLVAVKDSASFSKSNFQQATLAMAVVQVLSVLANNLQRQLQQHGKIVMAQGLQVRVFEAIISKDMEWWEKKKTDGFGGEWALISEVWSLPDMIERALTTPQSLLNQAVHILAQIALVRRKSSRMLRVLLGLHFGQILLDKLFEWLHLRAHKWSTRGILGMKDFSELTWVHALMPANIKLYQSFVREPTEAKELRNYLKGKNIHSQRQEAVRMAFEPFMETTHQMRIMSECSSMGELVQTGQLDGANVDELSNYGALLSGKIQEAYSNLQSGSSKCAPLAKAYDFLSIPSKMPPLEGFDPGHRSKGHIVFEDVCFAYPSRMGTKLLDGVSFEVQPGQVVGITGPSNHGKSTCMRLLERFYDVTAGRVLLDGRDIREYKPRWLRAQFVAVEQEPKLLPLTIRQNLTFGCLQDPSASEIEQACRSANIWNSLSDPKKFPKGLETEMSESGNISGGEKQRICIARAILADPPILLLDEATSALDEVNQHDVQEALNKLMKGRTTFCVAHRLSTIKDADKIITIRDGKKVDDGTHEELLAQSAGLYHELWKQQVSSSGKPPVPAPVQRTTTPTGKFEILRQAVRAGHSDSDDLVTRTLGIIDELEQSHFSSQDNTVPHTLPVKLAEIPVLSRVISENLTQVTRMSSAPILERTKTTQW